MSDHDRTDVALSGLIASLVSGALDLRQREVRRAELGVLAAAREGDTGSIGGLSRKLRGLEEMTYADYLPASAWMVALREAFRDRFDRVAEAANVAEGLRRASLGHGHALSFLSQPTPQEFPLATERVQAQSPSCPLRCPHGDPCVLSSGHIGGCNHRICGCNEPNRLGM